MIKKEVFKLQSFVLIILFLSILSGCFSNSDDATDAITDDVTDTIIDVVDNTDEDLRFDDWSEETHGKKADANYTIVFPQDKVNRIDITIEPENWKIMWENMEDNYGEFGSGRLQVIESDEDPVYVPCNLEFEGLNWKYVGIRFKGNSTLSGAWSEGNYKIPLRLDLDEFEDDYPIIDNQRFYGFKKLTLSSGYNDESLIREKITADIFRDAGVPAPQTAFYRVFFNYGDGEKYLGLYTMIEDPDGPMLDEQFNYGDGNLYKPDGDGADFSKGSFAEETFTNKTNDDEDGWSDILSLFNAIHSDNRINDTEAWKDELESILNVDEFLKWLAVNTVIQNWDTYGKMTHNYYLYNNEDGQLQWIPWDNNEAINSQENVQRAITSLKTPLSLNLTSYEVSSDWPLIRYLIDNDEYKSKYVSFVKEVINEAFEPTKIKAKYDEFYNLIYDYAIGENGEIENSTYLSNNQAFDNAFEYLKEHVDDRYQAALDFLEKNE